MEDWVQARLADLAAAGLLRDPVDSEVHLGAPSPQGGRWLDACSNDYLGLGQIGVSRETLVSLEGARPGAGASRLVQGTFAEHTELEEQLAAWLGTEASLLTTSAFAANLGLIPALADPDSLVVSDALNHASIVDGCRLARARVVVTSHLDLSAVEKALSQRSAAAPAWVVTEGLFSMDGDSPDLAGLRGLCDRFGAGLVVDEAHSLGVLGPSGAGLAAQFGVYAEVIVAGLGKAVGSQGGVLASSKSMRTWLWNRARSFVFSTAPSPVVCRITSEQVRRARAADASRARLQTLSSELRAALGAAGLPVLPGAHGPIVPLLLGSNERAMGAMAELRRCGILVQAIRPPTVPLGAARLRLTVHADWPDDAVRRIVLALEAVCGS
jgi:8-amino-7-oxononanoate synthase